MAYDQKTHAATLRYLMHQLHVGATPIKLSGVARTTMDPGATYFRPGAAGRLLPVFASLNRADVRMPFDTAGIGQLITLGCGMAPYAITGAEGNIASVYWAGRTELGGISDVGISGTINKGVLHIAGISAQQNQPALASVQLIPLYDGTNAPIAFGDVASLVATCGALSAENLMWTLGSITIDNVALKVHTGFTLSNLPFVTLDAEGSPYAVYGNLGPGTITARIALEKPTPLSDLNIEGIGGFGTKTDPPVAATSAVLKLDRCDANGKRRAVGDGDIEINFNYGDVTAEAVEGAGPGSNLVSAIVLNAHDDGTGTSVTFTRNADA